MNNVVLPEKLTTALRLIDKDITGLNQRKTDLIQGWLYGLNDLPVGYRMKADYSELIAPKEQEDTDGAATS